MAARLILATITTILSSVAPGAGERPVLPGREGSEGQSTAPINAEGLLLTDFVQASEAWRTVDDVVMGGVSSSTFVVSKGIAAFKGTLSLANNGGFASAWSTPRLHDLANFDGLCIRVRGDGKRYAFRVRTTPSVDGISYEVRFDTKAGEWIEPSFPLDAFRPVFRGRDVPKADPLNPGKIQTFGVLISDKQEGPFLLEIDRIMAYKRTSRE